MSEFGCPKIYVRKMTCSDIEAILELILQFEAGSTLVDDAKVQLRQELNSASKKSVRFVACVGGKIVGTMGGGDGAFPSRRAFWADWLVVDIEFRRMGVASLLYKTLETYVRGHGVEYICLDVGNIDSERAAYLFHCRNGFHMFGQLPDYWSDFEHLSLMVKRLAIGE